MGATGIFLATQGFVRSCVIQLGRPCRASEAVVVGLDTVRFAAAGYAAFCDNRQLRAHLAYKASKQRHPTPACQAGHARSVL
jgi:hypothetical protein